jgi:hypothetical protein
MLKNSVAKDVAFGDIRDVRGAFVLRCICLRREIALQATMISHGTCAIFSSLAHLLTRIMKQAAVRAGAALMPRRQSAGCYYKVRITGCRSQPRAPGQTREVIVGLRRLLAWCLLPANGRDF